MPAVRRRPGIVSVATLAGFVLTVGMVHVTAPEWSHAAGLDVWNIRHAREDLTVSLARGAELDARNARILEQIRGSDGVVVRVETGRLTLTEATAELDALNADRPAWVDGLRYSSWDVPTHQQRVGRYVMQKIQRRHGADPTWTARLAHLDAEYAALGR